MTTPISDDPIDIIEQEAAAVAHYFGVQAADDFAKSLVHRLTFLLDGERVHFTPRRRAFSRARRDEIRAAFTGRNFSELARRFGVSVRYVRKIVNG